MNGKSIVSFLVEHLMNLRNEFDMVEMAGIEPASENFQSKSLHA